LPQVDEYEVVSEGQTYREWCIPAAIVNARRQRLGFIQATRYSWRIEALLKSVR
jgi:hypothetical protein